tara:strand:+ start:1086 stop:1232 length:147 start_codon:yes stop_codon:yes gene_type:complete
MSLALFLSTALLLTPAEGVQWTKGSFDDALKQASESKKLVYIDFYTDW